MSNPSGVTGKAEMKSTDMVWYGIGGGKIGCIEPYREGWCVLAL